MAGGQILYISSRCSLVDSNLQLFYDIHVQEKGEGSEVESRFLERRSRIGGEKWRSWTPSSAPPRPVFVGIQAAAGQHSTPDGLRRQGTFGRARAFYELLARLKFVRLYPATSFSVALGGKGKSRDNKKKKKRRRVESPPTLLLFFLFFSFFPPSHRVGHFYPS